MGCIGCLNLAEKIDVSWNALQEIPATIGKCVALTELDLCHNEITSIPTDFYTLNNLVKLQLSYNKIEEIMEGIGGLEALQYLDLSMNCITSLPFHFHLLKALVFLDLSYNKIEMLPEGFGMLSMLKELNISHNSISDLPQSFYSLTITKFSANNCRFKRIHDDFAILPLEEIDLSKNMIFEFCSPLSLPKFSARLKKLNLSFNQLHIFPQEIEEFKEICELDYSNNKIKLIPNIQFNKLPNLKKLSLSYNKLSELPSNIVQLRQLKVLLLRENKLSALPQNIGNLLELEELDLSHNHLNILPKDMESMKDLKIFNLTNNCLEKWPNVVEFLQKYKLKHVNMSNNPLTDITRKIYGIRSAFREMLFNAMHYLSIQDYQTSSTICNEAVTTILCNLEPASKDIEQDLKGNLYFCKGVAGTQLAKECRRKAEEHQNLAKKLLSEYYDIYYSKILFQKLPPHKAKIHRVGVLSNETKEKMMKEFEENRLINIKAKADLLSQAEKLEQNAVEDLSQAIRLDYEVASSYYARGVLYLQMKKLGECIDDLSKCIQLCPTQTNSYTKRAEAYERLGQHPLAIIDYSNVLKLTPTDEDIIKKKERCIAFVEVQYHAAGIDSAHLQQGYSMENDGGLYFDATTAANKQRMNEMRAAEARMKKKEAFRIDKARQKRQELVQLCLDMKAEFERNDEMEKEEEDCRRRNEELRLYLIKKHEEELREADELQRMQYEESLQLYLIAEMKRWYDMEQERIAREREKELLRKEREEKISRRGGRRTTLSNLSKRRSKRA